MSDMTPQQAADRVEHFIDRHPLRREFEVLIDHARATSPEGGDLAELANELDEVGRRRAHLTWEHAEAIRDQLRAHRCAPAPSVAAPPREDLIDCDGDRWRDHGDDSWWPVTSPKLSNAATASRRWVERHFGPLVPAAAPGTVRNREQDRGGGI